MNNKLLPLKLKELKYNYIYKTKVEIWKNKKYLIF